VDSDSKFPALSDTGTKYLWLISKKNIPEWRRGEFVETVKSRLLLYLNILGWPVCRNPIETFGFLFEGK
jgi:hypothetical protein